MPLKKIDTIYLKRTTGVNPFGEYLYGDEESFKARWNDEVRKYMDSDGIDVVSVGTIFYEQDVTLAIGDLVSKTSGDGFKQVKGIKESRNGTGTRFLYVAYLKNTNG